MANRRMGGMGGGPRGARSFSQHQPFQGSGVSPWQGAPNSNQGLLSNPQQIAMALSSLLQPQQNNPPSLLSLNTSPAFSSPNRSFDRFGNRGRDMRRHEPYNKNRSGGWKRDRRNDKKGPAPKGKNKNDDKKKEDKVIDLSTEEGKEDENKEGNENEDKELKEGPYVGVPAKYLHCFVCGKEMWDGESMEKHVRGRAHRQMLDSLEESTHLTVNILREHMRLAEEKKVIEWNRMKRGSKFNRRHEPESHCNMCELKFLGKIVAHRKTEGHQRLKRYLHPNCELCDMEFPSRLDWVEHRMTPDHLKKLHESLENKEGDKDGDVTIDEEEPDLEPILDESLQMEAEFPVFELTDDLTGLQNLIPAYKPDRAVSKQSLNPFSGFRCQLCNRSFENEELAQEHLKTRRHYYTFIEAATAKYKEIQAQKEKEEKEPKKVEENGEAEMYDPEEACNENGKEDADAMDTNDGDQAENTTEAELQVSVKEEDVEDKEEVVEVKVEKEVVEVKVEKKTPEKPAVDKKPAANPTPATRPLRTAAAAAASGGAVRNGAGPKSKKLETALPKTIEKLVSASPSNYRIPKLKRS